RFAEHRQPDEISDAVGIRREPRTVRRGPSPPSARERRGLVSGSERENVSRRDIRRLLSVYEPRRRRRSPAHAADSPDRPRPTTPDAPAAPARLFPPPGSPRAGGGARQGRGEERPQDHRTPAGAGSTFFPPPQRGRPPPPPLPRPRRARVALRDELLRANA